MPALDKKVYEEVKEEADRISKIMIELIRGSISAQEAERKLGANYSSFSRKKLNKSAWVTSRLVAPLQDTLVYNQDLYEGLPDTAFGSFCEFVFGTQVREFSEDFFTSFLPFVQTVVLSVSEKEQKWFEKFFKGSAWLGASSTGDFLVAISSTVAVSNTRRAFVERSIANIIKNVSKTWYVDRGLVFRYVMYKEVSERLLKEGQVLAEVEGVVMYRPKKDEKTTRIEPCLTVDLFNSKIRGLLRSRGILYLSDLETYTKIGLQSFKGLGISSFWKIENVVEGLGYQFKVVEV